MVDITERKRAERALRASERKYSDAFKREREAAQRLRMLDEMKNTFLEAVSHDLRTPLTSILGSALTLERSKLDLPEDEALDMVGRIAANARKLERLLSDLLDLDRLQRGIVSPKRRATDLEDFVHRAVQEMETHGRVIELDIQPGSAQIDQAKTERILENLLSNSLRHTPKDAEDLGACPAAGRWGAVHRGGRRSRRRPRSFAKRSSSRSDRRRGRPPSTRQGSASGCRSSVVSPSSTAATPGPRNARAEGRRSTCSCPVRDLDPGRPRCSSVRSEPAVGLEPTT